MPARKDKTKSLKSRRVIFRLNQHDYEKLKEQAKKVGLSPGLFARQLSFDKSKNPITPRYNRTDPAFVKRLDDIALQLKRIGSNLNQLVKNSHIFKRISPKIEMLADNIDTLCKQIEKIVSDAIEKERDE